MLWSRGQNKWTTRTANRIKCAKFQKRHSLHRTTTPNETTKKKLLESEANRKKEWSRAQACWAVTSLALAFAWKKNSKRKRKRRANFFSLWTSPVLLLLGFGLAIIAATIRCGQRFSARKKRTEIRGDWFIAFFINFALSLILSLFLFYA